MYISYIKIFIFSLVILTINSFCTEGIQYRADYNRFEKISIREGQIIRGKASYYAEKFHGKRTANGEIFDMYKRTGAHRTLPFNTMVRVKNLENNKSVIVRINDRGPFIKDRLIDLSYQAAIDINMTAKGIIEVEIKILKIGKSK